MLSDMSVSILSFSRLHFKCHFCLLIFTLLTLEKSAFGNSPLMWEACASCPHGSVFYLGMEGTLIMRGTEWVFSRS